MEVLIGERLTLEDLGAVAYTRRPVALAPAAGERVLRARAVVEELARSGRPVYGITTGVGGLADVPIPPEQTVAMQANVVRSHAAGVGELLPPEAVRAMMLLRAHGLALGYSGVRPETLHTLIAMLNAGIVPLIPSQGSVGASGDLAPLAHLALAVMGEGQVLTAAGGVRAAAEALREAGLQPVVLAAKEGVALINGTQMMTALGALALLRAEVAAKTADVTGAMSAEALLALPAAFDADLHRVRPQEGQQRSAANLRRLLAGSRLTRPADRVQDAYALRCMPQVHGAARDGIAYARRVVETEVNSATDNPLVFPEADKVVSGGNFHGQPVALALDVLAIAVAALGTIAERRIDRLLNPQSSGLPPFLARAGGLHSGLMLAQYTAAALVAENKVLAHPASVDSIPTSGNQEDHVSMGSIAARKAARVVEHVEQVVGIEALCAAQALEFRGAEEASPAVRAVYRAVRQVIPPLERDRVLAGDLALARDLVRQGILLQAAEEAVGPLE
ncbi:MAG: histidine ammonia-lyase [Armatimonadota bacterium]|nr:histidine ammonia-lyase [Armatimonadota bacterium]MDR7427301.1 histidine ammonia-lyase [Armatimonadota bacterium]MDR7463879.1 histidine ammonia-lyase [Armatimonadota bacterium]MDR7469923.1 histidine ammonia-lyase [Armatimonadota bacterium]MDR7474608.1 histidine ammonia-lyase [Armatimonadota bacterium]